MQFTTLADRKSSLRAIIEAHWPLVYDFALRMTMTGDRATLVVEETFLRAYLGLDGLAEDQAVDSWLLRVCNHVLEQSLPRTPELTFDMVEATVSGEDTRESDVTSLSDPERRFRLWQPDQGCMNSVVGCLAPGERAAFVLAYISGFDNGMAASALGITKSAYKVWLSRAQKKVADYLGSRCGHLDELNPCKCSAPIVPPPGRAPSEPSEGEVTSESGPQRYGTGHDPEDSVQRDIQRIYRHLPMPTIGDRGPEDIIAKLEAGDWDGFLEPSQREEAS